MQKILTYDDIRKIYHFFSNHFLHFWHFLSYIVYAPSFKSTAASYPKKGRMVMLPLYSCEWIRGQNTSVGIGITEKEFRRLMIFYQLVNIVWNHDSFLKTFFLVLFYTIHMFGNGAWISFLVMFMLNCAYFSWDIPIIFSL